MIKSAYTLIGNPSALFPKIMNATLPLSMGPAEITFLTLFVVAIFIAIVYSKRERTHARNIQEVE